MRQARPRRSARRIRAARMERPAIEPTSSHHQANRTTGDRQVSQASMIPAMDPAESRPTPRTDACGLDRAHVISALAPSLVTSSATKPSGTRAQARKVWGTVANSLGDPRPDSTPIPSKVSQSPVWTPIGGPVSRPIDSARHGEADATGRRKLTKTPLMRAMADRLKQGGRRSRYCLRKQVVEPAFGQIKQARGFRQFLLRGLDQVRGE